MGLELVELVIEVEETFGIIVSDDTAANIRTVGQLHDYILDRRRQTQQHGCPIGHVFRDIRRVLTETTSVPRQAIRPSTELKTILPPQTRRRVWKRLQQEVPGRLRGLRLPFRLGPVLAGAGRWVPRCRSRHCGGDHAARRLRSRHGVGRDGVSRPAVGDLFRHPSFCPCVPARRGYGR